jgi:DNA (cytosine-5)-methyltransferase 1
MTGLTVGSLFSGIGGLDLGLERAGMAVRWHCETDPFCSQVLARHWPDVPNLGDVTNVDWSGVERVDVVAGGFPCQPFSYAGLRNGVDDERWLWPAYRECLRVLRPWGVVVENVAALVTDGDAFGQVLGDLHELGFDAEWSLVSECSVGAPHARQRLFVVAHRPHGDVAHHMPRHQRQTHRDEPRGSRRGTWRDGWLPEPPMDRVAHGLPLRMVRNPLHALGNAVVPAVAELVAERLLAACLVEENPQ